MRDRLPDAPWWVHSIIGAVVTGGLWALAAHFAHWFSSAPVSAAIVGGIAGAVSGASAARGRAKVWDEVSPMPSAGKAAIVHAAHRGPVPSDPVLREAARQLLAEELDARRDRSVANLVMLALIVGALILFTPGAFAAGVSVVLVVLVIAKEVNWRRRWPDRLRLLGGHAQPSTMRVT